MRVWLLVSTIVGVSLLGIIGCEPGTRVHLSDLPGIESDHYKVDPYIRAAVKLQSLNRATALKRLYEMATARNPWPEQRVIVLCRMLFTQRPGSNFRSPGLGVPRFLDNTNSSEWPQERTESKWPLEPIALVDGVPFLITYTYYINGCPELDVDYLRYCEDNCDWSEFRYSIKTKQQERDALHKLLASAKWRAPLNSEARNFLEKQIQ